MGMRKRDIAFAHCCVYLLAWLIGGAEPELYRPMKDALSVMHNTLNKEDEATSQKKEEPKWMALHREWLAAQESKGEEE